MELHQVAFRALMAAVVGGAPPALAIVVVMGAAGEVHGALLFILLAWAGCGAWQALLSAAESVSRLVRPALRPLIITLLGAVAAVLAVSAVAWFLGVAQGGAEEGWRELGALWREAKDDLLKSLQAGVALLLTFVVLGAVRAVPERRAPAWLLGLIGAATGLAAFGFLCLCWGPPGQSERRWIGTLFALAPALAGASQALADRAGERLRARLAQWRDAPGER